MKINPRLVNQIYKNQIANIDQSNKQSGNRPASIEKLDTITISAEGSKQKELIKLTQSIINDVNSEVSLQRLAEIKAKVENNQYKINTEILADNILRK